MFNGFKEFIRRIRSFIAGAPQELTEDLSLSKEEMVKMVKLQLAKGMDGNGQPVYLTRPLGGKRFNFYAPKTIQKKLKYGVGLGSVTEPITNYMSGSFYNSIYVNVMDNGNWEIMSSSPLFELIKIRSGEDIINLSIESERYLVENRIAPEFQAEINRLYFL